MVTHRGRGFKVICADVRSVSVTVRTMRSAAIVPFLACRASVRLIVTAGVSSVKRALGTAALSVMVSVWRLSVDGL